MSKIQPLKPTFFNFSAEAFHDLTKRVTGNSYIKALNGLEDFRCVSIKEEAGVTLSPKN